jgi:signal transduction histidine kinase
MSDAVELRKSMRSRTLRIASTVKSVRIIVAPWFNLAAFNWPSLPCRVSIAWMDFIWIAIVFLLCAFLAGWAVCRWCAERLETSRNLRFQNQLAERTRIARDLNDTLLQTIEASKMIADDALDPASDPVHMRRTMSRLSDWLGQATKEGQQALDALRPPASERSNMTASPFSLWIQNLSSRLFPSRKRGH